MASIRVYMRDSTVELDLDFIKANKLRVTYNGVTFFHDVEDMLSIVATDIIENAVGDEEEEVKEDIEVCVTLRMSKSSQPILQTIIDANAEDLADVFDRFTHFASNIEYTAEEEEEIVEPAATEPVSEIEPVLV